MNQKQSEVFGKRIEDGKRNDSDYVTALKNSVPNGMTKTMEELVSNDFSGRRYFVQEDENGKKHVCLYAESNVTLSAFLFQYKPIDYENAVSMVLESITVINQVTSSSMTYTGNDAKKLLNMIYSGKF